MFPRGTRLLISGVNGFLGANAAAVAAHLGAEIAGADLPGTLQRAEKIRRSLDAPAIAVHEADLASTAAWTSLLQNVGPHAVLHLAGVTQRGRTERDRGASHQGNVLVTESLVGALDTLPEKERPVVVCPGSQMEYGLAPPPWTEETVCRPANPYAESKLRATELLLAATRSGTCPVCVARLPLVYGPGQLPTMFVPELICKALEGTGFKMTEGRQRRRFIHAADAARFLLGLGLDLLEGRDLPPLINVPSSEPVAMREVAEMIVDILDIPVHLRIGALPQREGELQDAWPDDAKARALGYSGGMSLEHGLRQTVEWYRDQTWFRKETVG